MKADTAIGIASAIAFGFLCGYWAGEERAAIALKPCPQYPYKQTATSTIHKDGTQTCQYINTYAKRKQTL